MNGTVKARRDNVRIRRAQRIRVAIKTVAETVSGNGRYELPRKPRRQESHVAGGLPTTAVTGTNIIKIACSRAIADRRDGPSALTGRPGQPRENAPRPPTSPRTRTGSTRQRWRWQWRREPGCDPSPLHRSTSLVDDSTRLPPWHCLSGSKPEPSKGRSYSSVHQCVTAWNGQLEYQLPATAERETFGVDMQGIPDRAITTDMMRVTRSRSVTIFPIRHGAFPLHDGRPSPGP
jgi:hypothetical protein